MSSSTRAKAKLIAAPTWNAESREALGAKLGLIPTQLENSPLILEGLEARGIYAYLLPEYDPHTEQLTGRQVCIFCDDADLFVTPALETEEQALFAALYHVVMTDD